MVWTDSNARSVAMRWGIGKSQMTTYRREGYLPDYLVLYSPATRKNKRALTKLLNLAEDKWLKAAPMSRMIGRTDSFISQAIGSRKGTVPQSVTLYREDIETLEQAILAPVKAALPVIIKQWKETQVDCMYSQELQQSLIDLLNTPCMNLMRVTMGLSHTQHNRVSGVVAGRQRPFTRLADKPLLMAVFSNLQELSKQL